MKQKPATGQAKACNSEFFGTEAINLTPTRHATVTALEPQRALGYSGAGSTAPRAVPVNFP